LQVQPPALREPLLLRQEGVQVVIPPPAATQLLDRELLVLGKRGTDLNQVVTVGTLELKM
jgi:hypothetical protein